MFFDEKTQGFVKFNKDFNRLQRCFGKDPNDVEMNGNKLFANLSDRDKGRVSKVFNGTARKYNKEIIDTSFKIAEAMGINNADHFMDIIEIVCAKVEGIYFREFHL